MSVVLDAWLEGLDHRVEFAGAVDLSPTAIGLTRGGSVGFGEVVQPTKVADRVVSHEQDVTGARFHQGEQEQRIGAEIGTWQKPESGSRDSRTQGGSVEVTEGTSPRGLDGQDRD